MMTGPKRTTAALLRLTSVSPAWADPEEDAAERAASWEAANHQGARVRERQPRTIICNRLHSRRTPEKLQKYADLHSLADRSLAEGDVQGDVETCMTMRLNWAVGAMEQDG